MKNETPPTVSLADVLAAVRDRRDNGGGSASYRQACNHLIEAVQLLRPAHTPAPDTRLPEGMREAAIAVLREADNDLYWAAERGQPYDYGALIDKIAAAYTPHPAVEVTEKRAREVLRETAHDQDCPYNMSEWDKAIFSSSELLEMGDCRCDQVIRAMLAFAASASTTEDGV